MKNKNTLTIRFESWNSFKNKAKSNLKNLTPSVDEKNVLYFASVIDYQKFMTEQKIAILAMIVSKKPDSIYKLAQLLDRDFANVQRDCTSLDAMGFIKFKDEQGPRQSKKPVLSFAYKVILVEMPNLTYGHNIAA